MGWFGWLGDRSTAEHAALDARAMPANITRRHPLDVWHFVLFQAFGTHALAPLSRPPQAVLDVACGTGLWARDIARAHPQARVMGFDIDHRQFDRALEEGSWRGDDLLPSNCSLTQADALRAFPYPDGTFDYTHLRFFSPFVPAARMMPLLGEMLRVTRPGGWIEVMDAAHFAAQEPGRQFLLQCLRDLYQRNGMVLEPGTYLESQLRQLGLRQVQARAVAIRAGRGDDDTGERLAADLLTGMVGAGALYVRAGVATEPQVSVAIQQAQRGHGDTAIRVGLTAAWGQVPAPH